MSTPLPTPPPIERWRDALTDRELLELRFAVLYAQSFHHGTSGHQSYMLIAKLHDLLLAYQDMYGMPRPPQPPPPDATV